MAVVILFQNEVLVRSTVRALVRVDFAEPVLAGEADIVEGTLWSADFLLDWFIWCRFRLHSPGPLASHLLRFRIGCGGGRRFRLQGKRINRHSGDLEKCAGFPVHDDCVRWVSSARSARIRLRPKWIEASGSEAVSRPLLVGVGETFGPERNGGPRRASSLDGDWGYTQSPVSDLCYLHSDTLPRVGYPHPRAGVTGGRARSVGR